MNQRLVLWFKQQPSQTQRSANVRLRAICILLQSGKSMPILYVWSIQASQPKKDVQNHLKMAPLIFFMNYNLGQTTYNPVHHTTMQRICPMKSNTSFTNFLVLIPKVVPQTCHNSHKICAFYRICKVKKSCIFH